MDNGETQVLLISDMQTGVKTPTFNLDVCRERMETLIEKTIKIGSLHKKESSVENLVIMLLGDIVHGERVGFQVSLDELQTGVHEQKHAAVEMLTNAVTQFSKNYKNVYAYGVHGNHGVRGKFSSKSDNVDIDVYETLQLSCKHLKNVEMGFDHDSFYQIVQIGNFKYLMFHGHQQKMSGARMPIYGLESTISKWYLIDGMKFDVAVCGHFHTSTYIKAQGKLPLFVNGCFTTNDPFTIEKLAKDGTPAQWSFFTSEDHPVTAMYEIDLLD